MFSFPGLLISVPFLLATACVYTLIRELRDTHGKALACHSVSLATAFSCLAATQLAGHAFPTLVCSVMGKHYLPMIRFPCCERFVRYCLLLISFVTAYLIQFSFVSCFFWLNVMCFDTLLNVRYVFFFLVFIWKYLHLSPSQAPIKLFWLMIGLASTDSQRPPS